MIYFSIKNNRYSLPTSGKEITYRMFVNFANAKDEFEAVAAFSGCSAELLRKAPTAQFIALLDAIRFFSAERAAKISTAYEKSTDIFDLPAECLWLFEQQAKNKDIFERRAIAVACFYFSDVEKYDENLQAVFEMPAEKVFGLSNFFLSRSKKLSSKSEKLSLYEVFRRGMKFLQSLKGSSNTASL